MSRVKIIIILSIFLFYTSPIYPQQRPNSIYLELLGSGGVYSINYDRLFTPNIGGRIGFSYLSLDKDFIIPEVTMYFFPLSFNYFVGNGSSKLEFGVGMTFVTGQFDWFGLKGSGSIVIANFNIGYRYQPVDGGLLFRIGFNPVVTPNGVKPWGGLSIGLTF
jgi:hypothetical protein